jgi:hypothetical protein
MRDPWFYTGIGTSGYNGWVKGTESWFSAGGLYWVSSEGTGLALNTTSSNDVACNMASEAPGGTYTTQNHDLYNISDSAFFTRVCTHGTESLWACASASLETGEVELRFLQAADITAASPVLLTKAALSSGVSCTENRMKVRYQSGGTWWLQLSGQNATGSLFSGTLRYAGTDWRAGLMTPAIAAQSLGGNVLLSSSYYVSSLEDSYLLSLNQGFNVIPSRLPSSITFTGAQGLLTRSRALSGEMLACSGRFLCRCDMYWSSASDEWLSALTQEIRHAPGGWFTIECAWGTFLSTYVPGSLQTTKLVDGVNTISVSFAETIEPPD